MPRPIDMKYQEKLHEKSRRSYLELDLSSNDQEIRHHNLRPLCPKPRRPPLLVPLPCNLHSQQNGDDRSGILNRLTDKEGVEESRNRCMGCYEYGYITVAGSPPRRTANPVVHDVQFLNQMDHNRISPFTPTKLNF